MPSTASGAARPVPGPTSSSSMPTRRVPRGRRGKGRSVGQVQLPDLAPLAVDESPTRSQLVVAAGKDDVDRLRGRLRLRKPALERASCEGGLPFGDLRAGQFMGV